MRPYKKRRGNLLAFLLFLILLALSVAGIAYWKMSRHRVAQPVFPIIRGGGVATVSERPPLEQGHLLEVMDREFTDLVQRAVPSVVSITTSSPPDRDALIRQFFGLPGGVNQNGKMGSGIIVSPTGHIVTNWHVVAGAAQVTVQLNDGRAFAARLAGADQRSDIAVLKIDADGLPSIPFGDSEHVRVGQMVFAVGNPFGLQETVTQGIISAKGRRTLSDAANEFFQTSTIIDAGNSGGPLIDIRGEVIGINNFILSHNGISERIGFAIPSNVARKVYEDIVQRGRVVRPWFGVVMRPLNGNLARQLGLPDARGALVAATLPSSPAEKSGLQSGDVILSFNDRPILDGSDLRNRVAEAELGTTARLKILRSGKPIDLKVIMEEAPGN
jgi:serine protease Do